MARKLSYQITADTSGFTRGVTATRGELRQAKRIMEDTQTPAQRYQREVRQLDNLHRKGAITASAYHRRLRQLKLEKMAGVPVIGRMANSFLQLNPALLAVGVGLGAITVAARLMRAGLRAGIDAVKTQLGEIDEITKSARTLGVETESLIGLRLAAEEFSGVTEATFDKSLKRMVVRIGEAANGTGEAKTMLEQLGLSAQQLATMSPDQAFVEIAESIRGLNTPAEQAAAAYAIFGRQGVELLNTLRQGRDGLQETQTAVETLGLAFSAVDGSRIEAANDAMGRASAVGVGLARELTIEVAPALLVLAEGFVQLTDRNSQFGQTLRTGISLIGPALAVGADAANGLLGVLQSLQAEWLGFLSTIVEGAATADKALAFLPGRTINQGLQDYAVAFRTQADALAEEANERLASGFGGDITAQVLAMQDGFFAAGAAAVGAGLDVEALADAAEEAAAEAESVQQSLQAPAGPTAFESLSTRLAEQIETFGMSADALELYRLEQDGATESEIAWARTLQQSVAAQQEQADLMERGRQLTESLRSPQEKLQDEIAEYDELLQAGAISQQTYADAVAKARGEIEQPVRPAVAGPIGVDASAVNSQQAAAAIARFRAQAAVQQQITARVPNVAVESRPNRVWELILETLRSIAANTDQETLEVSEVSIA